MLHAGANRSTHVPSSLNDARASVLVVAPDRDRRRHARGEDLQASASRVAVAGGDGVVTPAADRAPTALSSAGCAPPPRLMFATAGDGWCRRHPVDAGDDAGGGAAAGAVEHADGDELHALGDAVGRAADGAGDVGAVAVAVVGGVPSSTAS